jgi:hypothetical protein
MTDAMTGEQLAVTVEIDGLWEDESECVGILRHSGSTKHS